MATMLAPINVDSETDDLISHAAHFLRASKKHVVNVAVREYIEGHRDEVQEAALDAMRALDGTTESAVQLLTGASDEELEELGGFSR
ncbi:MAG: hypothetical protein ACTH31_04370 [Pseudoclavibacter sp.]